MIDIIGNIKVNEQDPKRVQYFIASLLSYGFLRKDAMIRIGLVEASEKLIKTANVALNKMKWSIGAFIVPILPDQDHGSVMRSLIGEDGRNKYYLQFEEDHFCVPNEVSIFKSLLAECVKYDVDVVRASFFKVEHASIERVQRIDAKSHNFIWRMHQANFTEFNHRWQRYFIGTNGIFKKQFAMRMYAKPGTRPHDFEQAYYSSDFEHTCCIPAFEILRAIDDDHGVPGSCMLNQPTPKFTDCMHQANELIKKYYK